MRGGIREDAVGPRKMRQRLMSTTMAEERHRSSSTMTVLSSTESRVLQRR